MQTGNECKADQLEHVWENHHPSRQQCWTISGGKVEY